jgi:phage/plasmid-associated DNA primase
MWTGDKGNNGKSVMQRLFNSMLGTKFCIKMETTLITGAKPNAGGAWPELSRAGNGVRAVFFDELTDEEEIRLSMFKKLSGNDTFAARDCFEKGKDMKDYAPMFKMFIISNKLARFHKGGDQASWNRVCVIPFESVFVDPADPAGVPSTYEEQMRQKRFPMDKKLDEKVGGMAEAFAWILLQRRINPVTCYKPEKVLQAIMAYRRRNDIYRQYIEDRIVEDDRGGKITLQELYNDIKDWIKDSLGGNAKTTMPEKAEVKDYFMNLWGEDFKGVKWCGKRFRTMQDDIDDGTIIIIPQASDGLPPM